MAALEVCLTNALRVAKRREAKETFFLLAFTSPPRAIWDLCRITSYPRHFPIPKSHVEWGGPDVDGYAHETMSPVRPAIFRRRRFPPTCIVVDGCHCVQRGSRAGCCTYLCIHICIRREKLTESGFWRGNLTHLVPGHRFIAAMCHSYYQNSAGSICTKLHVKTTRILIFFLLTLHSI